MLVSTETAMNQRTRCPICLLRAFFCPLHSGLRSMALPPDAWTLNIQTPRRAAARDAPKTVLGMS